LSGRSTSIIVAAKLRLFRDALTFGLQSQPDFRVLAHIGSAEEAAARVLQLRPDIVLVNVSAGGVDWQLLLRHLAKLPARPLMLVEAPTREQELHALSLGARGVVAKHLDCETVFRAIRHVAAGELWFRREVLSAWADGDRPVRPAAEHELTDRELEVLHSLLAATSNHEIAEMLGITENTVKRHLSNVYGKLGISSRLELALYVMAHHLDR